MNRSLKDIPEGQVSLVMQFRSAQLAAYEGAGTYHELVLRGLRKMSAVAPRVLLF